MLIKTTVDVTQGIALCDLILRKLPFATNNALTRTAQELVQVERDELKTEFQVRKQFILNRVRITKYSKPGDLWTRVEIDRNVSGGELLLTMFEDGGEKLPGHGSELAVPITGGPARPNFSQSVRPSLLYKALNMQKHTTAGGKIQYKGDRRTFVVPGIGIFQRGSSKKRIGKSSSLGKFQGRGGAELRDTTGSTLIYRFKPGVPLHQRMHFVKTARQMVGTRFPLIWREEFVKELAGHARKR